MKFDIKDKGKYENLKNKDSFKDRITKPEGEAPDMINNLIDQIMRDYTEDLGSTIVKFSVPEFKKFMKRWQNTGVIPECFSMASDNVLRIAIYKMVYHRADLPEDKREYAKKWLIDNGYDLEL